MREDLREKGFLNGAVQVVLCPPKIIFRSKWKCWEIESSLTPPLSVFYRAAAAHQDWNQRSHFTSNLSVARRRDVIAADFYIVKMESAPFPD